MHLWATFFFFQVDVKSYCLWKTFLFSLESDFQIDKQSNDKLVPLHEIEGVCRMTSIELRSQCALKSTSLDVCMLSSIALTILSYGPWVSVVSLVKTFKETISDLPVFAPWFHMLNDPVLRTYTDMKYYNIVLCNITHSSPEHFHFVQV